MTFQALKAELRGIFLSNVKGVPLSNVLREYESTYHKSFKPNDYGFENIKKLIEYIPDVARILPGPDGRPIVRGIALNDMNVIANKAAIQIQKETTNYKSNQSSSDIEIKSLINWDEMPNLLRDSRKPKSPNDKKNNNNSQKIPQNGSRNQISRNNKNTEQTIRIPDFSIDNKKNQYSNKPSSFDMRKIKNFLPPEDTSVPIEDNFRLVSDYYADNFNSSHSRSSSASSKRTNNSKHATNSNKNSNNMLKINKKEENLPQNTRRKRTIPPNMQTNSLSLMFHELFVNPPNPAYLPSNYYSRFCKGVFPFPWPHSLEIIITHFEENPCFFWGFILEPKEFRIDVEDIKEEPKKLDYFQNRRALILEDTRYSRVWIKSLDGNQAEVLMVDMGISKTINTNALKEAPDYIWRTPPCTLPFMYLGPSDTIDVTRSIYQKHICWTGSLDSADKEHLVKVKRFERVES